MSKASLQARSHAVTNAIASQRLEGLEPDSGAVADLQRFARGEVEIDTVLSNFKARIARGEVRGKR